MFFELIAMLYYLTGIDEADVVAVLIPGEFKDQFIYQRIKRSRKKKMERKK